MTLDELQKLCKGHMRWIKENPGHPFSQEEIVLDAYKFLPHLIAVARAAEESLDYIDLCTEAPRINSVAEKLRKQLAALRKEME